MTSTRPLAVAVTLACLITLVADGSRADGTYQSLPFSQGWNASQFTANDDWSGVPGVIGYRGDNLTMAIGTDPRTITADDTPGVVDVNIHQTDPNVFSTGGVTDFSLPAADEVVALTGSATADAPYIVFFVNASGKSGIKVSYTLRDLESGADNAAQQVALQFRLGGAGSWTNVPAGYVADASVPNATSSTPVSVTLPGMADGSPQLQIRIITTNAFGNDEWIGVDDVSIVDTPVPSPANCSVPTHFNMVGTSDGVADPLGQFSIIVRNASNVGLASVPVSIDFSACSDVLFSSSQPFPGVTADCPNRTVSAITDGTGAAVFRVVGSVVNLSSPSGGGCATVRAGGVTLANVSVGAFDLDAINGIGAGDMSLFLDDLIAGGGRRRSDYSGNGTVSNLDLVNFFGPAYFAGGSTQSGERCDAAPTLEPPVESLDGGLNVGWSDCVGNGGGYVTTFACDDNGGTHPIIFSAVAPPGVTGLLGIEADVVVAAQDGSPLPAWWNCSGTSRFTVSPPGFACMGPMSNTAGLIRGYPTSDSIRFRVISALPASQGSSLSAGVETSMFQLDIVHSRTTGDGSCAGCNVPVRITFESLRLVRNGTDIVLRNAASRKTAYWQSGVLDVPSTPTASVTTLEQLGPNPFTTATRIGFTLSRRGPVRVAIFNVLGQRVATLLDQTLSAGTHEIEWDGRDRLGHSVSPGIYYVAAHTEQLHATRKLIKIR